MAHMDHNEALQQLAVERYLLDELPPDLRDAFEEHFFDCPECALDVRAGSAFVDEAKVQLPGIVGSPEVARSEGSGLGAKKRSLLWWWRPLFATPMFAAPVFATLLVVIGYQNLVTYPALRTEVVQPRLLPSVSLHAETRGGASTVVKADRKQGVVLRIEVPEHAAYSSYAVDLFDPEGKLAWTQNFSAAADGTQDDTLSLMIPGAGLKQGSYVLAISGVASGGSQGQRTEIERQAFAIHFNE
jgi:putative zinc finger protein